MTCFFIPELTATMVFVHVLNNAEYDGLSRNFVSSYAKFPPGADHETLVVFNNGEPTDEDRARFSPLPKCRFLNWNNSGQDIGGFIAASQIITSDCAVYFGCTSYLQRAGWLERMLTVWAKYGPGFYGSLGTYEVSPHINTTGFWCAPEMLRKYPHRVNVKKERYAFEHGDRALWLLVAKSGFPALLATWDGEYSWPDWRRPWNIYRRGDQSNCLTYFRHSTNYALASSETKRYMEWLADTITDPTFK
jgi:hypothetical protein